MDHIIEINGRSMFSLAEAQQLLPIVFRITKCYSQKVDALIERLESLAGGQEELANSIEAQVNALIHEWQCKVQKLGALPKGLWIADFDSGDGYYCWKYPERGIEYWHKYSDGFSKRVHVSELCDQRNKPIPIRPSIPEMHLDRASDRIHKKIMPAIPIALRQPELTD